MKTSISEDKENFLKSEFFIKAWEAAVQHNGIYSDTSSSKKLRLRNKIQDEIESLILSHYADKEVSDDEHCKLLVKLQKSISDLDADHILNKPVKIGFVQKLLNMLLKYYWCMGWIKMPPHLPVDRINFSHAKLSRENINWTKITTIDEYNQVISLFKDAVIDSGTAQSLAAWELKTWSRRNISKE